MAWPNMQPFVSEQHAPAAAPCRVALLGLYPADPTRIVGGVEAVVATLAHELAALPDMEVHVLSGSPAVAQITREQHGQVTVHRVPEKRLGRLFLLRTDWWWLRRAIRAVAPDVVHAHGSGAYVDAALSSRLPAVVTVHGVVAQEARLAAQSGGLGARLRWTFDRIYERYCLARARDIIVISPYLLREFPWLAQRARTTAIENPVNAAFFDIHRAPSPATILCPARIIARKGILDLIQAFSQVAAVTSQAELRLAGEVGAEPDYARRCLQAVQAFGLGDRVQFLGSLPAVALREELATCTAVALAAYQETAPVTIAEALAAGVPVVATAVGGVPDMIEDGQTGLLSSAADADALAANLRHILDDAALAQRLGRAGQAAARARFHPAAVAAQTRALYHRVMRS